MPTLCKEKNDTSVMTQLNAISNARLLVNYSLILTLRGEFAWHSVYIDKGSIYVDTEIDWLVWALTDAHTENFVWDLGRSNTYKLVLYYQGIEHIKASHGYSVESVFLRLRQSSQLHLSYMGLCVFSLPISLVIVRTYVLSYYHHWIGNMNH